MDWKVDYTKTFLKELASLPKETQRRAEDIVFRQLPFANPFEAGYVGSGPKTPDSVPCVKKKRRLKSVSPDEKRSMRRHLTILDATRR